jgi:hypothetical protein
VVGMEWLLELLLVGLLGATLFHAVRLERALGVLKRDRAELEALVAGFNASTRQAEQGVDRLRQATDGAGKQIARQIDSALSLKDDLTFLLERAERAADRLDGLVRSARPLGNEAPRLSADDGQRTLETEREIADPRIRSQAERDLLKALRMVR